MTNSVKVLIFIKLIRDSFVGSEIVYKNGSCYKFYLILKYIFPAARAYYNSDHIITEIEGEFYDITRKIKKTNHLPMDEHYKSNSIINSKFNIKENCPNKWHFRDIRKNKKCNICGKEK